MRNSKNKYWITDCLIPWSKLVYIEQKLSTAGLENTLKLYERTQYFTLPHFLPPSSIHIYTYHFSNHKTIIGQKLLFIKPQGKTLFRIFEILCFFFRYQHFLIQNSIDRVGKLFLWRARKHIVFSFEGQMVSVMIAQHCQHRVRRATDDTGMTGSLGEGCWPFC